MNFIKKFFIRRKIKSELMEMISQTIDLKNKRLSELQKTDLDSIDLMTLLQLIEKRWGKMNIAELYQAQNFDDIVTLIMKNQS